MVLHCFSLLTLLTSSGHRVIGKSTFGKLWNELCPFIVVAKPMTDLCWKCQQNNTHIYRSANLTNEEKNALLLEQQQHLSQVCMIINFHPCVMSFGDEPLYLLCEFRYCKRSLKKNTDFKKTKKNITVAHSFS